jgi:hypothetical protein
MQFNLTFTFSEKSKISLSKFQGKIRKKSHYLLCFEFAEYHSKNAELSITENLNSIPINKHCAKQAIL